MRFGSWGGAEESVFERKGVVLRTGETLQPQIIVKTSDYQETRSGTR